MFSKLAFHVHIQTHSITFIDTKLCCVAWHAGQNRPLDDEELDFLNHVYEQEQQKLKAASQHEQQELEAFRQAVQAAIAAKAATAPDSEPSASEAYEDLASLPLKTQTTSSRKGTSIAVAVASKPQIKPAIKVQVKQKAGTAVAAAASSGAGAHQQGATTGHGAALQHQHAGDKHQRQSSSLGAPGAYIEQDHSAKRQCITLDGSKQQQQQPPNGHEDNIDEGGLAGLLGGYGSDDSEQGNDS